MSKVVSFDVHVLKTFVFGDVRKWPPFLTLQPLSVLDVLETLVFIVEDTTYCPWVTTLLGGIAWDILKRTRHLCPGHDTAD